MKTLDERDYSWYNSLSEEDKKSLNVWTLMRWASSVKGSVNVEQHYIQTINEFVNVNFNILRHHPELQWRLMQLAGIGAPVSHAWQAPPKGGKRGNARLHGFYTRLYPHLNDIEVSILINASDEAEHIELLEQHGFTDKEIKELMK